MKIEARPWTPQDLLDDLQGIIDEESDNYLNTRRTTLETALSYLKEYFAKDTNVPSWIPVTERLPDKDGAYIVCTTTGAVTTARFYVGKTYPPTRYRHTEYHSPTKWQSNRNVTHWMPLPEPPKEVE